MTLERLLLIAWGRGVQVTQGCATAGDVIAKRQQEPRTAMFSFLKNTAEPRNPHSSNLDRHLRLLAACDIILIRLSFAGPSFKVVYLQRPTTEWIVKYRKPTNFRHLDQANAASAASALVLPPLVTLEGFLMPRDSTTCLVPSLLTTVPNVTLRKLSLMFRCVHRTVARLIPIGPHIRIVVKFQLACISR